VGKFSPHITVSKGLPPDKRHLKPTRKRTRLIGRRTIDEASVVDVDRWPLPGRQHHYGVLHFFAVSCNACSREYGARTFWNPLTAQHVEERLNENDGYEKGRVVFVLGADFLDKTSPCAALTYHIPRAGTVKILHLGLSEGTWNERRTPFYAALLTCADAIARESGDGRTSRLEWVLSNRAHANDAKARYQFREATRGRDGYELVRTNVYR